MASFPRNSSPSSVSTSDQSDYDGRRSQEYGEPTMYSQENGPYWIRHTQEHEQADTSHEIHPPTQGEYPRLASEINEKMPQSDHSSMNQTIEGLEASEQVLHRHNTSHTVDHDMTFNQQTPSQVCDDEELQGDKASAEATVQTFQQKATEFNNGMREDLAPSKSVLAEENMKENARAQEEIEAGIVKPYPRAIPESDGEEYAPGISYSMYLRLRTKVCGKVTPSKLAPGQPPMRLPIRTKGSREFGCPICRQRRVRVWHVECHFPRCVDRNGNPNGLHWFDHPTVLKYYQEGTNLQRRKLGTE